MTRRFVVTGGMGFGKTTLVNALRTDPRIATSPEVARELVAEELRCGGPRLPWKDIHAFESELMKRRVDLWNRPSTSEVVLHDRGVPDAIAFFRAAGLSVPQYVWERSREYRYERDVFFLPEWSSIYVNRAERPQSYEQAVTVGHHLHAAYAELGYSIIIVPKDTVDARVRFVERCLFPESP